MCDQMSQIRVTAWLVVFATRYVPLRDLHFEIHNELLVYYGTYFIELDI